MATSFALDPAPEYDAELKSGKVVLTRVDPDAKVEKPAAPTPADDKGRSKSGSSG